MDDGSIKIDTDLISMVVVRDEKEKGGEYLKPSCFLSLLRVLTFLS
jgi:hypothetical protein